MSIQITPEDRRLYRKEYVTNLGKFSWLWHKLRWFIVIINILCFILGIIIIVIQDENSSMRILEIIQGVLLMVMGSNNTVANIVQWNSPQRKYEKARAIREILDAEETEIAAKSAQWRQKL